MPVDRWAMMDQRERAENTEPTLAAEPIEKTEASEPADATDRIEPAEPIDRIEPLDPMLRIEPEDPSEREEPEGIRITAFWPACAQPDGEGRLDWQPVNWTEAERAKGQAWGLKTITSFHIHGMPPVAGHSDNQNQDS